MFIAKIFICNFIDIWKKYCRLWERMEEEAYVFVKQICGIFKLCDLSEFMSNYIFWLKWHI